jgi:glycosyltransferase involved in cell wall biosynthesis
MTKIFIIAPYFPPSSLPPSQRARMMVNNMGNQGYEPIVFTTFQHYREEATDPWMVELLKGKHEIVMVKALDPKITRKFGVGDLGLRVLPFLIKALIRHRSKKPAYMIYLVPPWYLLLAAPLVKWITRVPYAIDFIDPWVAPGRVRGGFKKRVSQWIARRLEGWVTANADYIYAVSSPINEALIQRHPRLRRKVFSVVPYGVEVSDYTHFQSVPQKEHSGIIKIRYVGAVWNAAYPVLEPLLKAFGEVKNKFTFQLEFIGTSYANKLLSKKQLDGFSTRYGLEKCLKEIPDRRPYKEAMQLTMSADLLLIFGDMNKQYAASKLMGLIASGKPFLAFLHRETSPYRLLNEVHYPYLVGYSNEKGDLPEDNFSALKLVIEEVLDAYHSFTPFDLSDERLVEHTAAGMTKKIMIPITERIKHHDKSHK